MLALPKATHIKLGWLWKLARHRNTFGIKNWKKRYITLNTKSRVLSYYKSKVDFEKKKKFAGNIILPKAASVRRSNADRDFCLEIWDGNGVKLLVLAANTEAEIDLWFNTLTTVCEQTNRAPDRKSQNRSSILEVLTSDRRSRHSERTSSLFLKGLGNMKSKIGDRASKLFGKDDEPTASNSKSNSTESTAPEMTSDDNVVKKNLVKPSPNRRSFKASKSVVGGGDFSRIVRVQSCGSQAANGTYRAKYRGISCGAPIYVNGNGFTLQLENVPKSNMRQWYIKHGSRDFYECNDDDRGSEFMVPCKGWVVSDHGGQIPVPEIVNRGFGDNSKVGQNDERFEDESKHDRFAIFSIPPLKYPMADSDPPEDTEPPNPSVLCVDDGTALSMDAFNSLDELLIHKLATHDLLAEVYCENLPPFIYKPQQKIEENATANQGPKTGEGAVTNELDDALYEDELEQKIETGYIPTLEEETKFVHVDEDISETPFAPPPPPAVDMNFMVPPPVYVSPRNKLKATSSFNLPPPPEYAEDLPPPPTFGFEVPPTEVGAPPNTVQLPPPPPPSLPSFGSLIPPPEEEDTQEAEPKTRRRPSKSALPPAPMSWDDHQKQRRTKTKAKLPSPRNWDRSIQGSNGTGDDDGPPPELPKALSLEKIIMETSPSPPPIPAAPPPSNIWDE